MTNNNYWLGLDIGSTTVKAILVDSESKEILYRDYRRHGAMQRAVALDLVKDIYKEFKNINVIPVLCGSGARNLALELKACYVQEVVANSIAVREFYPETRVAIELGGQDAKITFFHKDEDSGQLVASDMRMNGSCAGGTGAFLDEVATLLKIPVEKLNETASKGKTIYDISGRCGVFAKTDIQPLLNQGVSREDLALSCFHAVAKQTIGGLAQGLEIVPPVIFEGGPLFFNPALVDVYAKRLHLKEDQVIRPANPEVMIAYGAALSVPVMFQDKEPVSLGELIEDDSFFHKEIVDKGDLTESYFKNDDERKEFNQRHQLPETPTLDKYKGETLNVYLGLDAGSTTSKFVLINEDEDLIYAYYGKNHGEPLEVVKKALLNLKDECDSLNITLNIIGAGSTGYGEMLFHQAFNLDFHTVETVSHGEAAIKYSPEATFILDIGGQDMKAIFLRKGIITGITLNEACSAGCGSFLENFAGSLNIDVKEIAPKAFASKSPSVLGSRCTVFMNSSVITEQKNGKTPDDIMAGLCNSVVENVFTKVIRLSNLKTLGENLVVQGGTFRNDAVLRALEKYTGRSVLRAPYPGEMGAIGIALLTAKHQKLKGNKTSTFIAWDDLKDFSYSQECGLVCPYCSNNCNRTQISFSNGESFITGNRCEKGEILGDVKDPHVKDKLKNINSRRHGGRDIFRLREKLLFKEYDFELLSPQKDVTIGIPRVLEFWNSFPFWNTFFKSLGFKVKLSRSSNVDLYEEGLPLIPSDTICFPAKLVHGHIIDLVKSKVDRIFMPIMSRMITENPSIYSEHVCAVVKGYPMVIQASDEPFEKYGVPMDTPTFHWTDNKAKVNSIIEFMAVTFGLPEKVVKMAVEEGDKAYDEFQATLVDAGQTLLESLKEDEFAVVIAARPYHSDELVNHNISDFFTRSNIATLPVDAIPDLHKTDLSSVRAELAVNFHVRMYEAAQLVAAHPKLEMVNIVSFGCGHDAVISDELIRLLSEGAGKSPLILKLDESDVAGPLNIRVKSFIETVKSQRLKKLQFFNKDVKPYEVAYEKLDRKKTILVPNVSWAFTQVATAAISKLGYKVEPLPLAGELAIRLGKKYVHNDMCFPAQINIGEFLAVLDDGLYDPDEVVFILALDQCDCRLAHYAMKARQALDDAGYPNTPIVTTGTDLKGLHPGFSLGPLFELRMLWGLAMNDVLEDIRRKIRPYEINKGETDQIFEDGVRSICLGFEKSIKAAKVAFEETIDAFVAMDYDRSVRKPRIFMIGEFLLNFHPSSNNQIESYLEDNGLEVIMPNLFYSIHREYLLEMDQHNHYHVSIPHVKLFLTKMTEKYVSRVISKMEKIASKHPLWEDKDHISEISKKSQHIIDRTFTSGEGWLIAGEILQQAEHGVNSFLILQPFGCLPNHVTGRGLVKRIKKDQPHIQVLALDYDPDTSFGNIENRLQMLIINTKERSKIAAS